MEPNSKHDSSSRAPSQSAAATDAVASEPVAENAAQATLVAALTRAAPSTALTASVDREVPWWRQLSPSWHAMAAIAGVVLFGFLIHALAPVLTPFMFGAILSYLGAPIVAWLAAKGVSRTIGAVLVIVAFISFIAGLVLVVAPLIANEISVIAEKFPEVLSRVQNEWLPWVNQRFGTAFALDLAQFKTLASENKDALSEIGARLAGSAKFGGQLLITILINVSLIPVVMFYLLRDWPQVIDGLDDLLPASMQEPVRTIASEIDAVLSEFLRGQGLVMIALAIYYCVALSIVGLEFAIPVGLVTGLLVFIPYVGFGLGLVLGMLAALTQFSTPGPILAVAAVFAIGQILEGFVLVPYLVGDRIGLHPLAVIFALMAFGQLFGFVGVLLALPLSAALLVAVRSLRKRMQVTPTPAAPEPNSSA
jgi:predicted PurR-regulated permease PerM